MGYSQPPSFRYPLAMTEPPLFGSAAGSGPSPAGETPPSPPQGPMPGAMPGPVPEPPPGPEPTRPFGDWSTYGSSSYAPAPGSPIDPAQAGQPGPIGWTPPDQPGPTGWMPPTPPGQPSQTGFTYGPGPTGTPMPVAVPARRSSNRGAIIVVIVVVVFLLAAVGGFLATNSGGSKASASPDRGVVVFSDDFRDPTSGWSTETLPSGTTYKYTDKGYVIVAFGQLDHLSGAPTARSRPQLTSSVTATQTTTAPEGAGFGVTCVRGTDATEIRYEFVATVKDRWTVSRLKGALSDTDSVSDILKEGTLARGPGSAPLTVEGTCATKDDGKTTRLVMWVDGTSIVDFTDAVDSLPDDGWYPELIVSSQDVPSTVTASHFEVRTVPK